MLFLFSFALYFAYSAIEAEQGSKSPLLSAILGGVCLILMALTHWLTVWILVGYIIYCAVVIRPRGTTGIIIAILGIIASAYFINHNIKHSGSFLGSAYMTIYNNLSFGSENIAMRTYGLNDTPLDIKRLVFRILHSLLVQITDIFKFLGAVVAAPLFFLSLMHSFRKVSIAKFRWLILTLWVFAAAGMSIYGVSSSGQDSNQLHLLFIPIMTAYGLAFISIVWSKINLINKNSWMRNIHFVVVVALSAGPLILSLPRQVEAAASHGTSGGSPHWPPYKPNALNTTLSLIPEDRIIVTDQPWATAWYADRTSLWIPRTIKEFEALDAKATDQKTPIGGFLISPYAHSTISMAQSIQSYGEFSALVLDGPMRYSAYPVELSIFETDPDLASLARRFRYKTPLSRNFLIFYGDQNLKKSQ